MNWQSLSQEDKANFTNMLNEYFYSLDKRPEKQLPASLRAIKEYSGHLEELANNPNFLASVEMAKGFENVADFKAQLDKSVQSYIMAINERLREADTVIRKARRASTSNIVNDVETLLNVLDEHGIPVEEINATEVTTKMIEALSYQYYRGTK